MQHFSRCFFCKNYLGELSCRAFDKIPIEIFYNKIIHNKILFSQKNDIVFELSLDKALVGLFEKLHFTK